MGWLSWGSPCAVCARRGLRRTFAAEQFTSPLSRGPPHPPPQPEMIVLDPSSVTQVVREPREVQKEKQAAAEEVRGVGVSVSATLWARGQATDPPARVYGGGRSPSGSIVAAAWEKCVLAPHGHSPVGVQANRARLAAQRAKSEEKTKMKVGGWVGKHGMEVCFLLPSKAMGCGQA